MKKKIKKGLVREPVVFESPGQLLNDIRMLVDSSRRHVATLVNETLTALYWRVGKRIHTEMLGGKRAGYGDRIVHALSAQLRIEYGEGFSF
jgi:hypothetical protein